MTFRSTVLAAAAMAALACQCQPSERVLDIPVSDSVNWSRSVLCTYSGSSHVYSYATSEPAIVWGFEPPDIHGDWKRSKGFAAFPFGAVTFSPDRIVSCTLSFFRLESGPAPTYIRHVYVRVQDTPSEMLYQDGANGIVGTDTSGAAGWHHVALSELGVGTVKGYIREGHTTIGYCWDCPESGTATASSWGHDVARRPYLTLVYSDIRN